MGNTHTGRRFRGYLQMNDISINQAAQALGISKTYLNNMLALSDLPDGLRRRICLAYPNAREFVIPEWARLSVENKGK